jgi:hypothetical protein
VLLDHWAPEATKKMDTLKESVENDLFQLKQAIMKWSNEDEQKKHKERLDFLSDELVQQTEPRTFLIESIIESLNLGANPKWQQQLDQFKVSVSAYLTECL